MNDPLCARCKRLGVRTVNCKMCDILDDDEERCQPAPGAEGGDGGSSASLPPTLPPAPVVQPLRHPSTMSAAALEAGAIEEEPPFNLVKFNRCADQIAQDLAHLMDEVPKQHRSAMRKAAEELSNVAMLVNHYFSGEQNGGAEG